MGMDGWVDEWVGGWVSARCFAAAAVVNSAPAQEGRLHSQERMQEKGCDRLHNTVFGGAHKDCSCCSRHIQL